MRAPTCVIQGNGAGRLALLMRSRARYAIAVPSFRTAAAAAAPRAPVPRSMRTYSSHVEAQAATAATSAAHPPPLTPSSSKGKAKDDGSESQRRSGNAARRAATKFESLGLSTGLSQQLTKTFEHIDAPSSTQEHLIPAILASNDVIMRSQTGSGKSFGLLLALMAKPRIVYRNDKNSDSRSHVPSKSRHATSSLVLVPTNELAEQYVSWAKQLIPSNSIDSVIQAVVRGDNSASPEQQIKRLQDTPPHILVATPRRALEILEMPGGGALLGISLLRTLALDEVDSLLDLPGRYPTAKMQWKNLQHPPPGLKFLNEVMRVRGTYSGGSLLPSAGMEPGRERRGDERRPPENIRRTQHRSNERNVVTGATNWLAKPKILRRNDIPLQLIACSASANAVLRHFLGAKTGWLRVGVQVDEQDSLVLGRRDAARRDGRLVTGEWIDLTGLSGSTAGSRKSEEQQRKHRRELMENGELTPMPKELEHCCVIIDEGMSGDGALAPMRNFSSKRVGKSLGIAPDTRDTFAQLGITADDPEMPKVNLQSRRVKGIIKDVMSAPSATADTRSNLDKMVVPSYGRDLPAHTMDHSMLESLAYIFACEAAHRALVFIPSQWSLRSASEALKELGVPVVTLAEMRESASASANDDEPKLALIQSSAGRGLDIPALSHVFILGIDALGDAVQYTHLAGRTARLSGLHRRGGHPDDDDDDDDDAITRTHTHRRPGRVITLVRGLTAEDQIKNQTTAEAWRGFVQSQRELRRQRGRQGGDADGNTLPALSTRLASARTGKPLLISSGERKISSIYHRLDLRVQKVPLRAVESVEEQVLGMLDAEAARGEVEGGEEVEEGIVEAEAQVVEQESEAGQQVVASEEARA